MLRSDAKFEYLLTRIGWQFWNPQFCKDVEFETHVDSKVKTLNQVAIIVYLSIKMLV